MFVGGGKQSIPLNNAVFVLDTLKLSTIVEEMCVLWSLVSIRTKYSPYLSLASTSRELQGYAYE